MCYNGKETDDRNNFTAKLLAISGMFGKMETNTVKEVEQVIKEMRNKLVHSDEKTIYVDGVAVDFSATETALNFLRGL